MKTKNTIKWVWAVDVLDLDSAFQRKQKDFFLHLIKRAKEIHRDSAPQFLRIHPVYLLTGSDVGMASDAVLAAMEQTIPLARKALKDRIQSLGLDLSFFDEGQVLSHSSSSSKKSANLLALYARSMGAHAILLSSHGRKGLDRLMLGSFAEKMIHFSNPPTVILGKEYEPYPEESFLFATDLSPASKSALHQLTPLLQSLRAPVTLYHSLRRPEFLSLDPGILIPGGNLLPIEEFMKNEQVTSEALLQKWCDELSQQGISAKKWVGEAHGNLALEIQEAARVRGATWIALASEHGQFSATLFGSVARELARSFSGPVWIHHPDDLGHP